VEFSYIPHRAEAWQQKENQVYAKYIGRDDALNFQ
jgi:hypothetical protein